uniref:Pentatricopeptide repeat-containing protein n=1 Tax=Kalanchoe fedtschenkoi TaxID=63787 RepID=A0A7N0V5S1_KALFE
MVGFVAAEGGWVSVKQRCMSLLSTCSSMNRLLQIHAHILTAGLQHDGFLTSLLVRFSALSPSGSVGHARLIVYRSRISIRSSWNMLIRGYVDRFLPESAIGVFMGMRSRGIAPTRLTFPFLFKACAAVSALGQGRQFHAVVFKHGFDADVFVNNSLIHFYGACRKIRDARRVFDEMRERTLVSWNSVISGYAVSLKFVEATEMFFRMGSAGFEADEATFVIMLSACAHLGNLIYGKWLHSMILHSGMAMNCRLGTALVDMYAKCGAVDYAASVFSMMEEKNVWTWSAMILGLAQHGSAEEALELFQLMKTSSVRPNHVTFVGVLYACSHSGLMDDGRRFFNDLQVVYGIAPRMIHYGAMVDILSRAGRLKEAYDFILNMRIDPDPVVWRTLLSACRIHDVNDTQGVADSVRKKLLKLEPKRVGNLVMVANTYAEVGMFEKAAKLRRVMRNVGSKKEAGESSVVVDGALQGFFCG